MPPEQMQEFQKLFQNKNSYGSQASPVPAELSSEVSPEPACGPQALVCVWVHLS